MCFSNQNEFSISFVICFMREKIEVGLQLNEVKTDEG